MIHSVILYNRFIILTGLMYDCSFIFMFWIDLYFNIIVPGVTHQWPSEKTKSYQLTVTHALS